MSVRLSQVAFVWPAAAQPVLEAVDLVFEPGFTAVVGPNGSGKTTLLRLIAGALAPTAGRVSAPGPVHLCPQTVEHPTAGIRAFAEDWTPVACRWRGRLDLDPDALPRWATLSPGERKRWQLGAALAAEPAVLLLDEPTNHLDADGGRRLCEALARYRGIGVLVSHDRDFADALATRTVWLERRAARVFPMPPSGAEAQLQAEARGAIERLERHQDEVRRAASRADEARRAQEAALAATSVRRRSKGPRDHDARSVAAKQRAANGERRAARTAGRMAERAEQAAATVEGLERPVALGASVFVRYEPAPKATILQRPREDLAAGGRVLLRDAEVTLRRGEHVRLRGPNGAGKSTLVRDLVARSTLPADRLWVVPQELTDADAALLLQRLRQTPPETRGRVLQVVAALGVAPAALLSTDRPSPGEARKLAVAFGLGGHAWAVVLDEPTNHLDLPSVTRLQGALAAFPGALLLVTHDARLAAACCSVTWSLDDGALRVEAGSGAG